MRRLLSFDLPDMARLHAAAFPASEAWSAPSLQALMMQNSCRAYGIHETGQSLVGFVLLQLSPGNVDILTLAIDPDCQRQGYGLSLMKACTTQADLAEHTRWTLDVAVDNAAAIGFYKALGFQPDGTRRNYYRRGKAGRVDALLMTCNLTGH